MSRFTNIIFTLLVFTASTGVAYANTHDTAATELENLILNVNKSWTNTASQADDLSVRSMGEGWYDIAYRADSVAAKSLAMLGRYDELKVRYNDNLHNPQAAKDPEALARFKDAMLYMYTQTGDYVNAKPFMESVQQLLTYDNISAFVKGCLSMGLGEAFYLFKEYRIGLDHFSQARQYWLSSNHPNVPQALIALHTSVGNLYFEMNDLSQALEHYQSSLNRSIELNSKSLIGISQYNMALVYGEMKKWRDSLRHARATMSLAQDMDETISYAGGLEMASRALKHLGEYEEAARHQIDANTIFQTMNQDEDLFFGYAYLAAVYVDARMWTEAEASMSQAKALEAYAVKVMGEEAIHAPYLRSQYLIYKQNKDNKNALVALERLAELDKEEYLQLQKNRAQQLMIEYQVGLAKEQAAALEKSNALKTIMLEQSQSKQTLLMSISAGGVIILAIMVFVALRERHYRNKMQHQAMTDPLTQTPNRRAIKELSIKALQEQQKNGEPVALALLDLDRFKNINDSFGHDVGDMVLQTFTKTCQGVMRKGDHLGRYGGEEFLLVLPGAQKEDVEHVFTHIQDALQHAEIIVDGEVIDIRVTSSMGAVISESSKGMRRSSLCERFAKLTKVADEMTYRAKTNGRDQVVVA